MNFGLGRNIIKDERDKLFRMNMAVNVTPEGEEHHALGFRYWWADGWWGNQAATPQCVAYAWLHWAEDGPTTQYPLEPQRDEQHNRGALFVPSDIYGRAKEIDQWPGTDYDGTSIRAGAKALREKGLIDSFWWAQSIDDIIDAVIYTGPVVVGTWWYESMFNVTDDRFLKIEGDPVGGHAYLINGINLEMGTFRIKNSWGRDWGYKGFALITFDDMERLLSEDGEACQALETRL